MGDIAVVIERTYDAPAKAVFAALADYTITRPSILAPQFTDFQVLAGGVGAGTRFSYRLHATEKRIRQVEATVTEPVAGKELLETDANSSLTVLWTVIPVSDSRSQLTVGMNWQGATGIGGFFERRFAPAGIRRIYAVVLDRLQTVLD